MKKTKKKWKVKKSYVSYQASKKEQKNNTRDSNVVPHRSTNLARQCLTSLSRREAAKSECEYSRVNNLLGES